MVKKQGRVYSFSAKVKRTVLDDVTVNVRARGPKEAKMKAEKAFLEFPGPTFAKGIEYAYIENRENLDAEVLDINLEEVA